MKTTHLIRNASMLSLASLLIGTGCPDEEPSNGNNKTTQDMAEDDMQLDMPVIDAPVDASNTENLSTQEVSQ